MPSFFPFSSSRILAAVGTGALLVLIVILITGGFVIDAGPLHLSARRIGGPLAIALAAWAAIAAQGRATLTAAAASIVRFLDIHATALALIVAAAAAGAGVAYGTYSASGADGSGYVSQAALIASARIVHDEPLARQATWLQATSTFAPLGYRAGARDGELVPTYPSGLPATMAGARVMAGDLGPFLVSPMLGALAVFSTYLLGARLYSRTAGLIAAVLLSTSPIFLLQIVQPMSDVPATAWWTLAILLALLASPASAVASGVVASIALATRPNLLPLAVAPALLVAGYLRAAPRPALARAVLRLCLFAAGMVPVVAAQLWLQSHLYGKPFASGYGRAGDFFAVAGIWPNLQGYASRLLTGEAPALVLAAGSLLALVIARRRSFVAGLSPLAWPWLVVTLAVVGCYLPYVVFPEWSYLRFLLPAFPLTFVCIASLLVAATMTVPAPVRGSMLLVLVTAACSLNLVYAGREQAFNLHRYDARFRSAGRYLEAALPPNAVVLTVQESGSTHYYAHSPVVRWDLIGSDLDGTVSSLRGLGRHPVFLVEDWETPDFTSRFKTPMGQLDWRPRADIGDETRALLFDPADRETGGVEYPLDRVH